MLILHSTCCERGISKDSILKTHSFSFLWGFGVFHVVFYTLCGQNASWLSLSHMILYLLFSCLKLDSPTFSEVKGVDYIKNRISIFMSTPQGFWKRFTHEDQSNAYTKRGSGSLEPIFATCCQFWNHGRLLASPFLEVNTDIYVHVYVVYIYKFTCGFI